MCAIRYRIVEEEVEEGRTYPEGWKEEEEAPPEGEGEEAAAEWRERPFFLSIISMGLGSLGLLLILTAVSMMVLYFVPMSIYVPGLGFLSKPAELPGGGATGFLLPAAIMVGVGVFAYVAGYGLWHFRHWALALTMALAAMGLVFGIGITILHNKIIESVSAYFGGGLGEEQVAFLHGTTLVTAILVIGPAAFLIAYLVNIRHFFG